jgi:SAM-dependent methyltransferase
MSTFQHMSDKTHGKTMEKTFFEEYTSHDAILKYTAATAGYGISYLLDHDYKDVYLRALRDIPVDLKRRGMRILEFGCGGGMNLVHLVSVMRREGMRIEKAVGTDFSPILIDAARKEATARLPPEEQELVEFHVARNERLLADLSAQSAGDASQLAGSFDFILGVNTIRYCHRGGGELSCARDIVTLLKPAGVCVVIDMNNRFPAFRSALKATFRTRHVEECYIPSLEEYAAPFETVDAEILRKEHFCWVPHSAGKILCGVMRTVAPILNAVAGTRAMRSLVVARKSAEGRVAS